MVAHRTPQTKTTVNRLLIVGAAQRSGRPPKGLVTPIDFFGGPLFHSLRLLRAQIDLRGIKVYVLTAKYGLVEAHAEIDPHESKWPRGMNEELANKVADQLIDVLGTTFDDVLIILNDEQQLYLEGVPALRRGPRVKYVEGKLRDRQAYLESWIQK